MTVRRKRNGRRCGSGHLTGEANGNRTRKKLNGTTQTYLVDDGDKPLGHRYDEPSTGRFLTRDPIKDGRNRVEHIIAHEAGHRIDHIEGKKNEQKVTDAWENPATGKTGLPERGKNGDTQRAPRRPRPGPVRRPGPPRGVR